MQHFPMQCPAAREALSAAFDGEEAPDLALAQAHAATCADCGAYARALGPIENRMALPLPALPDFAARVVRPRVPAWEVLLRLCIVGCGLLELGTTLIALTPAGGGTDLHDPHSTHESAAFTIALCLGLIVAGVRPRLAAPYLPIIGAATVLNVLWSAVDISSGEITWNHEREHGAMLIGALLLALMAYAHGRGGRGPRRRPLPRPTMPQPPRMRLVLRAAAALAIVAIPVAIAAPASAHAVLESSTPTPGQVLSTAPSSISLHFDETVTILPTSLRVFGPDGSRVDNGALTQDNGTIGVGVRGAATGTYLVSWRVVSADSHPVSGAFTYSVGAPSKAPAETPVMTDRLAEAVLGAARALSYAGCALVVGAGAFALLGGGERSRRLVRVGGALLIAGSAAMLVLKGPVDAGLSLGSITEPSLLREVIGTSFGSAAIVRAVVGAAALALGLPRRPVLGRVGLLVVGVALAWSFASSGHAVGRSWPMLLDGIHVLAMSLWLGGLAALLVDGLPGRRTAALRRFSALALGSVSVLVLTGTIQAFQHVGAWGALRGTTYGRDLLIKVGVVAGVIAVAYGSRRLVGSDNWAGLKRTVTLEAVGAFAILGLSSSLSMTQPANSAWHPSVDANLSVLGDSVQVSAVPAGDRTMSMHVYVFGPTGQPVTPPELAATVALPSAQIEPLPVRLSIAGPGHWVATIQVPRVGDWTFTLTLRTTAIDEDTRTLTLPIR